MQQANMTVSATAMSTSTADVEVSSDGKLKLFDAASKYNFQY